MILPLIESTTSRIKAPMTVPRILLRPLESETPPMTAAAIAANSYILEYKFMILKKLNSYGMKIINLEYLFYIAPARYAYQYFKRLQSKKISGKKLIEITSKNKFVNFIKI